MSNVLVVDDQPDVCRLIAALLRARGHTVACAYDGASALAHLDAAAGGSAGAAGGAGAGAAPAAVGLVLLDYMMPGMNGLEVLRAVRSDARLAGVPVLMYSAVDDHRTRDEATQLGAQGWLVKGVDLWDKVQAAIERHARG